MAALLSTAGKVLPVSSRPTLHLTVGLPGVGKTTLARELEQASGALRLTPDESPPTGKLPAAGPAVTVRVAVDGVWHGAGREV